MSTDVLLIGAGGRVGAALHRLLPGHGLRVTAAPSTAATPDALSPARLREMLAAVRPRAVVYAAAIADPDHCEREPALSHEINVAGAQRAAEAATAAGARLLYYSTDYVFGSPGRYFEDAEPAPLQVYGRDKAAAERLVLAAGPHAVLRLPLLFGARDFVAEAVAAVRTGTPLAVDDRRRLPIPLSHVAAATVAVLTELTVPGVYHAVGTDSVTKARWLAYVAGLLDADLPPARTPAPAASRPAGAPRPVDIELASRHPQLCTAPGSLWAATRVRVAELIAG